MGYDGLAWVLLYIAAFGVSDTFIAIVNPTYEWRLVYYTSMGLAGARILMKSTVEVVSEHVEPVDAASVL